MNSIYLRLGALTLAVLSPTLGFAADDPQLPGRFKSCTLASTGQGDTTRAYTGCSDAVTGDFYGRIWLSFSMPELDGSYGQAMKKAERKKFFKRIWSLFDKRAKSGSLLATISVSQNGGDYAQIAKVELASFANTSGGPEGFTIKESPALLNSFLGPTFIGNPATTNVKVDLTFLSLKNNKTAISQSFFALADAAKTVVLLRSVADISEDQRGLLAKAEKAIAASYNAKTDKNLSAVLSFDKFANNAIRKTVTFNGAADQQPGFLFVGIARQPTILTDAPGPGEKLKYGDGRYSSQAANDILNKQVEGQSLKDYVKAKMPDQFDELRDGTDPAAFLAAGKAMRDIVESSDLGLNSSDQTAAKWAFLALSPLMSNAEVRKAYTLRVEERDGTLQEYGLGLPPIDPPALSEMEKGILDEGQASADRARTAEIEATEAAERANLAAIAAGEPGVAGNTALDRAEHRTGVWDYRGETRSADAPFFGRVTGFRNNPAGVSPTESTTGEKYEGALRRAGSEQVREGAGRVTYEGDAAMAGVASYTGQFANGIISGFGHMIWVDGSAFRGRFAGGNPAGAGLYTNDKDELYYVEYIGGVRQPQAIHLAADGKQIAGTFAGATFRARQVK